MLIASDEIINKSRFAYLVLEKIKESEYSVELANLSARHLLNFDRSEDKSLNILAEKNPNLACFIDILDSFSSAELDYKRYTLKLGSDFYTTHLSNLEENRFLLEIVKEYQNDISEISHELKRPIQNIKTLTETLIMGAKDKPVMCEKFLNNINDEIDRLSDLVKNLLKLSQLGDLNTLLSSSEVNITELTKKICESYRDKVKTKSMMFEMFCDGNIHKKIDKDLYNHLLTNLLDNAMKYNTEEGFIDFCMDEKGITLRNSSIGVKEADIDKLFNKFYRSSSSAKISGTGLGLTIVKNISELFSWEASASCGKDNVFEIKIKF